MTEPVEQKRAIAKAGKWVAGKVVGVAVRRVTDYYLTGPAVDLIKEVLRWFGADL